MTSTLPLTGCGRRGSFTTLSKLSMVLRPSKVFRSRRGNMATVLAKRFNTGTWALPLCLAVMDGCWVYIVAWLIVTQVLEKVAVLPVPSFLLLALLEVLSMWLASRLLNRTDLPNNAIQLISGVAGLAVSALLVFAYSPPGSTGVDGKWI